MNNNSPHYNLLVKAKIEDGYSQQRTANIKQRTVYNKEKNLKEKNVLENIRKFPFGLFFFCILKL